jgi:thioredoxin
MSTVKHVGTAEFENEVLHSELPVLVDFYTTWCMPCQLLSPVLEKLAEEFEGRVSVVKVDVDKESALAARYAVHAVPTLKIFQGGEAVDTVEGLVSPQLLRAKLERLAASAAKSASA